MSQVQGKLLHNSPLTFHRVARSGGGGDKHFAFCKAKVPRKPGTWQLSAQHTLLFHSLQASSLDSQWVGWQPFVPHTISSWLAFLQASLFAQSFLKGTQKRATDKAKDCWVGQGAWPVTHASFREPPPHSSSKTLFRFLYVPLIPIQRWLGKGFSVSEEDTEKWSHFDLANWKRH